MFIPNFNPFGFNRLSPRQRMLAQLQGQGLGNFGLMQVIRGSNGGGQVGVLAATNRISGFGYTDCPEGCDVGYSCNTNDGTCVPGGFIPGATVNPGAPMLSLRRTAAASSLTRMTPEAPALTLAPTSASVLAPGRTHSYVDPCTGVLCAGDAHCEGGGCVPNKAVVDTTNVNKVIDSPPVSTHVEETPPDQSIPDTSGGGGEGEGGGGYKYASGNTPDSVDSSWGQGRSQNWTGDAPANDTHPTYQEVVDTAPNGPPPSLQTQAQQVLTQPRLNSIPWWGFALGAAAAGFALYKFGGHRR